MSTSESFGLWIPDEIAILRKHFKISRTEVLILALIKSYQEGRTGECWLCNRSIANGVYLSDKRVASRMLSHLVKLGLVEIYYKRRNNGDRMRHIKCTYPKYQEEE